MNKMLIIAVLSFIAISMGVFTFNVNKHKIVNDSTKAQLYYNNYNY